MPLYGIIGAGGFGSEVMPIAEAMLKSTLQEDFEIVFVIENKTKELKMNQHLILSVEEFLMHPIKEKYFNIAISNCKIRKRIAEMMIANQVIPFQIDAPNRVELTNVTIDEGAILFPYTSITSNIKIGKFFHANLYACVSHDCIIGDYVTFAPHAQCNGNIIIEDHAYVGANAVIKQGTPDNPMIIGKGAIIGMGAVVTKSVPPFETVIGNPAKALNLKNIRDKTIQTS